MLFQEEKSKQCKWKKVPFGRTNINLDLVYYVLLSSRISRKSGALIVRYSQKKECVSFVFYCFENPSIANFGTTGLIQVGFSAKCTSPNENFNQVENWKCHMFDFRLIPLDRIIYTTVSVWSRVTRITNLSIEMYGSLIPIDCSLFCYITMKPY